MRGSHLPKVWFLSKKGKMKWPAMDGPGGPGAESHQDIFIQKALATPRMASRMFFDHLAATLTGDHRWPTFIRALTLGGKVRRQPSWQLKTLCLE
jgi:hypothetical protein